MANIKSSIKRIQIAERNAGENKTRKSQVKTLIKNFNKAIEEENVELAEKNMNLAESALRKANHKNILHINKVNREVSRMARKLNTLRA